MYVFIITRLALAHLTLLLMVFFLLQIYIETITCLDIRNETTTKALIIGHFEFQTNTQILCSNIYIYIYFILILNIDKM